MSEERQVKQSVVVETTPELAFEALTRASELREWFSDQAWTGDRPGTRYGAYWNQGYHAEGRFIELEAPRRAVITWWGIGEPGESQVEFTIKPVDKGVKVKVVHSGFGPGKEWDSAVEQAERGWTTGLENLKSTLESGIDLRLARQPFLGIYLDQLTPERAEREGIAVERGIYVNNPVEGSGAQAAGIVQGDVIVALGDMETPGFQELGVALRACQAGDTVDMKLVRGQKHETVPVTLGQRPQPEVPGTAAELADRLAERHKEVNAALKAALEGVTDEEAEKQPAEGEFSVKQVLAHLSDGERGFHTVLVNIAVNGYLDGGPVYADQILGRLDAIMTITPSLQGLLKRFLTDESETVALVRGLPDATLAHKARYRRICEYVLNGPTHTETHTEQIQETIKTVRGA
jgi:uncharacterized protein YndB with AHSA1/START domain